LLAILPSAARCLSRWPLDVFRGIHDQDNPALELYARDLTLWSKKCGWDIFAGVSYPAACAFVGLIHEANFVRTSESPYAWRLQMEALHLREGRSSDVYCEPNRDFLEVFRVVGSRGLSTGRISIGRVETRFSVGIFFTDDSQIPCVVACNSDEDRVRRHDASLSLEFCSRLV